MKTNLFYYPYLQPLKPGNIWGTANNLQYDFLQSLYRIIEDNIDNPLLNVEFLATNMAVSKSTLNRRLSIYLGVTAHQVIKQYRLQKAAILLTAGKNVSETAYLTGFETPSYFIQCFKEFYKVTPKVYSKCNNPFIRVA